MTKTTTSAASTLLAFSMLLVTTARASETYPRVLQQELGLEKAPPCTVCHLTDKGGENTAHQRFALSLEALGLVKLDSGGLRAILPMAEGIDSDGDGVSDLDELREGRNPNIGEATTDGDGGTEAPPPPPALPPVLKTGCSIGAPPSERENDDLEAGASLWVTLALGIHSARRSSRGKRQR